MINYKILNEILKQNNQIINEIKNNYNLDKIIIIGKGPTADFKSNINDSVYTKETSTSEENTMTKLNTITSESKCNTKSLSNKNYLTIGINQGLIFSGDIVLMNDFQSIFGIESLIKNIKYIFIPFYPHVYSKPIKNINYILLEKYLSLYGFTGKIFIYFLDTSLELIDNRKQLKKKRETYLKRRNNKKLLKNNDRLLKNNEKLLRYIKNHFNCIIKPNCSTKTAIRLFSNLFTGCQIHTYGFTHPSLVSDEAYSGYHTQLIDYVKFEINDNIKKDTNLMKIYEYQRKKIEAKNYQFNITPFNKQGQLFCLKQQSGNSLNVLVH